jgi:uncharacterized protein (DUF433 family)
MGDMPVRWWPLGPSAPVVIDPARSFGQPIVSTRGIPTAVLAGAGAAEGPAAKVAWLYDVTLQAVHAAVDRCKAWVPTGAVACAWLTEQVRDCTLKLSWVESSPEYQHGLYRRGQSFIYFPWFSHGRGDR